jgi:hypothetical protein
MNVLIFITAASLILAAVMGIVAWRSIRREQRRSEARIVALAAEIADDSPADLPVPLGLRNENLFDITPGERVRSQTPIALAAGALIVGAIIGLAVGLPGSRVQSASAEAPTTVGVSTAPTRATTAAPIELVQLNHARTTDGLTVRGVVRNPANGLAVAHLTAVVLLFNDAGGVVASGRAAVGAVDLAPGAEAAFAVTASGARDVSRYRVSFRTDDDRVVPHVDKRDGA